MNRVCSCSNPSCAVNGCALERQDQEIHKIVPTGYVPRPAKQMPPYPPLPDAFPGISAEDVVRGMPEPPRPAEQVGGDHYKDLAIQPAEYAHRNGLGPLEMNVVKYITRWRRKGGTIDLEKAIHCIELLKDLERRYPKETA